jgi:hypothetical protein
VEGVNRVSELTTQGVKDDLIAELKRRGDARLANSSATAAPEARPKGKH